MSGNGGGTTHEWNLPCSLSIVGDRVGILDEGAIGRVEESRAMGEEETTVIRYLYSSIRSNNSIRLAGFKVPKTEIKS